jgi:hypothetical protein
MGKLNCNNAGFAMLVEALVYALPPIFYACMSKIRRRYQDDWLERDQGEYLGT